MNTNLLTYEQCVHHAQHLTTNIKETLNTTISVLMTQEGDVHITVTDETKQGAIVEHLLNFWSLKRLSRNAREPILMFFELKEKN